MPLVGVIGPMYLDMTQHEAYHEAYHEAPFPLSKKFSVSMQMR